MRAWRNKLSPKGVALAAATVVLTAGLAAAWWLYAARGNSDVTPAGPISIVSTASFVQPDAYPCPVEGDFKPVDIPVGLLCDYYEHTLPHVPPREPNGEMQRRERWYSAPPDPFMETIVKRAPSLTLWFSAFQHGNPTNRSALERLDSELWKCQLSAIELFEVYRALYWLDSGKSSQIVLHSALRKALDEYADQAAGGTRIIHFLRLLDQTKCLWINDDRYGLYDRFSLSARLYPELSREARRAEFMRSECLLRLGRNAEAASAFRRLYDETARIGDLGTVERSEINEMKWAAGQAMYCANRFEESTDLFADIISPGKCAHSRVACERYIIALAKTGKLPEAQRTFKKYVVWYQPTSVNVVEIAPYLLEKEAN